MRHKILCAATTVLTIISSTQAARADFLGSLGSIGGQVLGQMQQQQQQTSQPPNQGNPPSSAGHFLVAAGTCGVGGLLINNLIKNRLVQGVATVGLCLAAFKVAQDLNERDRLAFERRSADLLAQDGPTEEVWTAPDSGKQITIKTGVAQETDKQTTFDVDQGVDAPEAGTKIEATTYVVMTKRLNFRSGPSSEASDNVIGFFDKGENVEVIGKSPDGKWALVGDNGVVVGYAAFKQGKTDLLLTPDAAASARAAPHTKARAKPHIIKNLSSGEAVIRSDSTPVTHVTVVASTQCKAYSAISGKAADSKTGCALPNGKWAMA
jgi:Bacterial SH3 domain